MKKYWKKILLLLLVALLAAVLFVTAGEVITFEALKQHSDELRTAVLDHYALSVFLFGAAFVMTAFFVPGALALTVAGGFLFGAPLGALYAAFFSAGGSLLAFLLSRHVIGAWVQQRYRTQLVRFNDEFTRHGPNYLFVLRVTPVLPSFAVNYLAGLTRISAARFFLFSFLGIAPGAVVYSLAGVQLKSIQTASDLLSAKVLIGLWMLAVFSLSPVAFDLVRWLVRTRSLRKKRTGS